MGSPGDGRRRRRRHQWDTVNCGPQVTVRFRCGPNVLCCPTEVARVRTGTADRPWQRSRPAGRPRVTNCEPVEGIQLVSEAGGADHVEKTLVDIRAD